MKKRICIVILCIFAVVAAVAILIFDPFNLDADMDDSLEVVDADTGQAAVVIEPADNSKRYGMARINIYSFDMQIIPIIKAYAEKHWDFEYELNCYTQSMAWTPDEMVNWATGGLTSGLDITDIYCFPSEYSQCYIKGEYSELACTYSELGINVDAALESADIPRCVIEDGSNPDGELIALPYFAETAVFMYRRSIARDVWGTDDPAKIADIIGAGTQKWDKFIEAAQVLKEHGYFIVPGYRDLIYTLDTSQPSAVQGSAESMVINPRWEEIMDVSKQMLDAGYMKDIMPWSEEWYNDLNGKGDKVFGFISISDTFQYMNLDETAGDWAMCLPPFYTRAPFVTGILVSRNSMHKELLGPLVEWITLDCSEEGLQYGLANGTKYSEGTDYYGKKLSVCSGTVMKKVDGSLEFLGGQNRNLLINEAMKSSTGLSRYYVTEQPDIFQMLLDATNSYIKGEKDKETVIKDFFISNQSTANHALPEAE